MEQVREAAAAHGDNAKAHGWHGWAGTMARRFQRFIAAHGERLGYDAAVGKDGKTGRRAETGRWEDGRWTTVKD